MDEHRFDHLTRSVMKTTSRRSTFRGVLAGIAAVATGATGLESAGAVEAAKCVKVGQSCKKKKGKPKPDCCGSAKCQNDRCKCTGNDQECKGECIKKDQCCNNSDCPANQKCDNKNKCGCPVNQKLCGNECIPNAGVCQLTVTPSHLRGWIRESEDGPPKSTEAMATIVNGPDTPPAGAGSFRLEALASPPLAAIETQPTMRTLKYEGMTLAEITELSFSVYSPDDPAQMPNLQLAVIGGNTIEPDGFTSISFSAGVGGNPAVPADTWSDQSPLDGLWWTTRDVFGSADECLICRRFGTRADACAVPGACTDRIFVTWDAVLTALPEAVLDDEGSFNFRIGTGTAEGGGGNVTNVRFNNDVYLFEED